MKDKSFSTEEKLEKNVYFSQREEGEETQVKGPEILYFQVFNFLMKKERNLKTKLY